MSFRPILIESIKMIKIPFSFFSFPCCSYVETLTYAANQIRWHEPQIKHIFTNKTPLYSQNPSTIHVIFNLIATTYYQWLYSSPTAGIASSTPYPYTAQPQQNHATYFNVSSNPWANQLDRRLLWWLWFGDRWWSVSRDLNYHPLSELKHSL